MNFNMSVLAGYEWTNSHPVDWSSGVEVLSKPRDVTTRLTEEAVYTTLYGDTETLPLEYDG